MEKRPPPQGNDTQSNSRSSKESRKEKIVTACRHLHFMVK